MYDKINDQLAKIRRHRPLWTERYTLDPAWAHEKVEAFESLHQCKLPEEYREFLIQCGVAGPGPDFGLYGPDQHFTGSGYEECFEDNPDLSIPFPYSDVWNDVPDDESKLSEQYFGAKYCPGSILISDRGCAMWDRLIITGPCAGEIWHDDRVDQKGLRPHVDTDGNRYTFLKWYCEWLDLEFYQFGHEGRPRQLE